MHKAATANGRRRVGARRQHGATALEFALVFPVFFMLFYGILSFGFIGLARMSLQHAAEEGARSALAWQADDGTQNAEVESAYEYQLRLRSEHAWEVSCASMDWLTRLGGGVCGVVVDACEATAVSCYQGAGGVCSFTTQERCQIQVTAQYAYGATPILPALPGFGIVVPNQLSAQARVILHRRAL